MYQFILLIHVAIGAIALLGGAAAILTKKGGKLHKQAGKVYYYCMYGIGLSAFVMTIIKFNPFLMSIAIFSVYMTHSGKRAIDNWRLKKAYVPTVRDQVPFYIALLTAVFMIGFPVSQMISTGVFYVPILAVFGGIMLLFAIKDTRKYSDAGNFYPKNKMWLVHHIGMMGGAYIATFTAFLVNNIRFSPGWVVWLLPTAVGTPLIVRASIQWSKKLKMGKENLQR